MSDLFIGEILVSLLLLSVLLRPFSRRLQRVGGIPLLPPIAFILCTLIVLGSGFRISFLPIFLVTVLAFVFGLIRLARLFLGLPTDWYKPLSVVWHSFLLAFFAGAVVLAFAFAPETRHGILAHRRPLDEYRERKPRGLRRAIACGKQRPRRRWGLRKNPL